MVKHGAGGKRDRTKAKLIETAWAIVQEKGFAAASLDEIAARAGMTKGAIYSNFGGKADLMFAAVSSNTRRIAPPFTPGGSLKQHLHEFAEALAAELPGAAGRARLAHEFEIYVLSEPELRGRIAALYERAVAETAEQLRQAHSGTLNMGAKDLAWACQALGLGYVHQSLLTPGSITKTEVLAGFEALAQGATNAT